MPSRATSTRKPSRFKPTVSASMKLSSSSTTSTVCTVIAFRSASRLERHRHRAGPGGDPQRERRALALGAVDVHRAAVVGGHVAHDRQTEAGAAGLAAAGPVDAVEALEDAVEVARRDADAVVGDPQLDPLAVGRRRRRDDACPARSTSRRSRRGCETPTPAAGDRRASSGPRTRSPSRSVMPRRSASWRDRSSASASTSRRAPTSRTTLTAELDAGQLQQVVDRAGDPVGLVDHLPAKRCTIAGSSSSASASASTASAPTGVFSSWLMLATKSVRTASRRDRSVMSSTITTDRPAVEGRRLHHDDAARRAVQLEHLRVGWPAAASCRCALHRLVDQHVRRAGSA